jgi:hypothetical protein
MLAASGQSASTATILKPCSATRRSVIAARAIELGGAVAGFPEQHHAPVGEPVEQRAKGRIVEGGQGFGRCRNLLWQAGIGLAARRMPDLARDYGRRRAGLGGAPSFGADQGHEADVAEPFLVPVCLGPAGQLEQALGTEPGPDRHHEAPARRKLALPALRHRGSARRGDDRIERRGFGPAERAIPGPDENLIVSGVSEVVARRFGEHAMALDAEHLCAHFGQHRGGVARPGSDFEHLVARMHVRGREHQRDDIGLRDSLVRGDRQGRVLVGELGHLGREEGFARHPAHGRDHARIGNPPRDELAVDHALA